MNHDISQPVPQGSDGAQDAENSRIAAIADELKRLCSIHETQYGDSLQDVSRFETELILFMVLQGLMDAPSSLLLCNQE